MAVDQEQEFGVTFEGLPVAMVRTFQLFPSIHGDMIGITFAASDGKEVKVAFPADYRMDIFIEKLRRAQVQFAAPKSATRN